MSSLNTMVLCQATKIFVIYLYLTIFPLIRCKNCHSRNFRYALKNETDNYLLYGLTQDCQIFFLRPSQVSLLSSMNVNVYNSYCHPNLVQLHLQSQDSLLLLTKQAGNRICTLNITIPPFDLLFGDHLFSYSIFNSLSYAVCSQSPPNSYQLEPDLSFMDTVYNNVIYFISGTSEGKSWDALQFLINSEGYLRYLDKFQITNYAKNQWTGPDIANEYVVGLDTERNFLFKRNRFQQQFEYECAYDLMFRPSSVSVYYGNDTIHKHGIWLNSLSADKHLLLYPETDRTVSPPLTYVLIQNVSTGKDPSLCLTTTPFSLDMGIVHGKNLEKMQQNPLPAFDSNKKLKEPLTNWSQASFTTHRHRKTTLRATTIEVTTANSIMTSTVLHTDLNDDDMSARTSTTSSEDVEPADEEEYEDYLDEATTEHVLPLPTEAVMTSTRKSSEVTNDVDSDEERLLLNLTSNTQTAHMNVTESSSLNLMSSVKLIVIALWSVRQLFL